MIQINNRLKARLKAIADSGHLRGKKVWVAGGALIRDNNDVDIFPVGGWPEGFLSSLSINCPKDVVFKSPNAITLNINNNLYQLCKYTKPTLMELLQSFDFAHCQIGASVDFCDNGIFHISELSWTEAYEQSRISNLSSLIRTTKYKNSGILTKGDYIRATIDALVGVIERGFKDYNDFKDQLDAVDLGLLPEELEEVERASLIKLFQLLKK